MQLDPRIGVVRQVPPRADLDLVPPANTISARSTIAAEAPGMSSASMDSAENVFAAGP